VNDDQGFGRRENQNGTQFARRDNREDNQFGRRENREGNAPRGLYGANKGFKKF